MATANGIYFSSNSSLLVYARLRYSSFLSTAVSDGTNIPMFVLLVLWLRFPLCV